MSEQWPDPTRAAEVREEIRDEVAREDPNPMRTLQRRVQELEHRAARAEGRLDWLEEQAPGVDCPCTHCAHLRASAPQEVDGA